MFDHEKLQVYGKALDFAAQAAAWTSTWDKNMPGWIISGFGRRAGIPGRDRGNSWQGNARQDQRHGGGVLNPERQSGRQSDGQSPQLLVSSR